jgi:hypothetical protein
MSGDLPRVDDDNRRARADAILARIPEAEMDRLAASLARLIISAARSGGKARRVAPLLPGPARDTPRADIDVA